jgi:hypothetical protein
MACRIWYLCWNLTENDGRPSTPSRWPGMSLREQPTLRPDKGRNHTERGGTNPAVDCRFLSCVGAAAQCEIPLGVIGVPAREGGASDPSSTLPSPTETAENRADDPFPELSRWWLNTFDESAELPEIGVDFHHGKQLELSIYRAPPR